MGDAARFDWRKAAEVWATVVVSPNAPPDSPHQSVVPKSLLKCSNASVERTKTFGSGGLSPQGTAWVRGFNPCFCG